MRRTALVAILLMVPSAALAEADGPDYYVVSGVTPGSVLNIRTAPDISAQKIGAIPAGETGLQNLGCEGGLTFAEWEQATPMEREAATRTRWCRVDWNGLTGWVAGWHLREGTAAEASQ